MSKSLNQITYFIFNFPLRGKGLFELLHYHNVLASVPSDFTLVYFSLFGIVLLVSIVILSQSREPISYATLLTVFFLFYPVFLTSYLIILVGLFTIWSTKSKFINITNFVIVFPSVLYEFAYDFIDSPYQVYNIPVTNELLFIGIISVFMLYFIMIAWIVYYFRYIYRNSNQTEEQNKIFSTIP